MSTNANPNPAPPLDDDFSLDDSPVVQTMPDVKPEDIDIEYVDNRPEGERQYETNTVDESKTRWTPDDKKGYGKNVRGRISQMDYKIHQTERERDQAIRERQALEEHAKGLQTQLADLKTREQKWGTMAYDATKARVENEIAATKKDIEQLLTSANPDVSKVVNAQEKLSTLAAQRAQVSQMGPPTAAPPAQGQPNGAPAQGPLIHPNYQMDRERWIVVNPWFGKDLDKTQKLIRIEQELVKNGVIMGSRAYWDAIDRAKNVLQTPANGQGPGTNPAGSPSQGQTRTVVSGSSGRTPTGQPITTGARRVVQLSQDERRAAARMGVSEQEWAAEKAKREDKQRALRG
jgi:hypothetical protein